MNRTIATRRYDHRVIAASLAYAVFLVVAVFLFKHHLISGPLAYVIAILPALAVCAMFVAMGRYLIEEQDEYLRMVMVRQSLWASALALTTATIWGFLESFDLAAHIDAYYIAVVWFGALGIGACVSRLSRMGDLA